VSQLNLGDDGQLAAWLAAQAGTLLIGLREDLGFGDPSALRAAGDAGSHELIVSSLARLRPTDVVLSEEGVRDDPARLSADRVWIIDPLDGTREFGESGRIDWAVHVALWSASSTAPYQLSAAALGLPAQRRVLTSHAPAHPPARPESPPRVVLSRSRAPQFLLEVAEAVGASAIRLGSAGAKVAAVILGAADAYLHAGGQYEWDSAAPVAVAVAAGLHASRLDGTPLAYNQRDLRLPDLMVCRPELAEPLLAAVHAKADKG
jgi:3'(2'), 5'-bisphosphate nucleotidase